MQRLTKLLAERAPVARRRLPWLIVACLAVFVFSQHFAIAWVWTESVNAHVVLVVKGAMPRKGDYVAFAYQGGVVVSPAPWTRRFIQSALGQKPDGYVSHERGEGFIKVMAAGPGERIDLRGRDLFLGKQWLGRAKDRSMGGEVLTPLPGGVIPQGYFYASAPHVDALDSRYTKMGLVPLSAVIGRAIKLF
jgi:conjugal transfer pilin signal peptidase TrbI